MFERTLQDLIRGLRAHKSSSQAEVDAFLAEAVDEIRHELRGREMDLKAEGVVKMCYVSPSWLRGAEDGVLMKGQVDDAVSVAAAAELCISRRRGHVFPAVPPQTYVPTPPGASSSPHPLAELGYLAAPMAFSTDTEEVVLTVNGIRKVTHTIPFSTFPFSTFPFSTLAPPPTDPWETSRTCYPRTRIFHPSRSPDYRISSRPPSRGTYTPTSASSSRTADRTYVPFPDTSPRSVD